MRQIRARHGALPAALFRACALLYRKDIASWVAFVDALPLTPEDKLRLVLRPSRRFMRRGLGVRGRIALMRGHYNQFGKAVIPQGGLALGALVGKSGAAYGLHLASDISKDGLLRLTLRGAEGGGRLASISGALDDAGSFWIGALQGGMPKGIGEEHASDKRSVADATKDLNGLRPKHAVLQAAASVAGFFGARRLVAPSRKTQIAVKSWGKGGDILTEYDGFWEDYAARGRDGDYVIPLPIARRKLEDVQPKRRKDWQLRYQRVDALAATIVSALEALSSLM